MPIIPDKLNNFTAWAGNGGTALLGQTDVELPSFESITEELGGAGIAGTIELPVTGHFGSQVLTLRWRVPPATFFDLLAPIQQGIQLRGSINVHDSTNGATGTQRLVIDVRGRTKNNNPGKLEVGAMMESETMIEVLYITIDLAGERMLELDKLNMIFKVRGTDYLRPIREDLGL